MVIKNNLMGGGFGMIISYDGLCSDSHNLELFHNSRQSPIKVVCIKNNPPRRGFGRILKKGDIVTINGIVGSIEFGFEVSVPAECCFYAYDFFEPILDN